MAELALEGVPIVAEHYDKVTDPLKNKTKQGYRKVKEMRDRRNGVYESESEEYDYDGPPPRRSTTGGGGGRNRSPPDYDRRRRYTRDDEDDGGFVTEERKYVRRGPPRAKSVGRDSRNSRRKGQSYHGCLHSLPSYLTVSDLQQLYRQPTRLFRLRVLCLPASSPRTTQISGRKSPGCAWPSRYWWSCSIRKILTGKVSEPS